MADREPDDLLGALPRARPQRRSARRDRASAAGSTGAGNRPKAAPGTTRGRASSADAAAAEPVGDHATSTGLAPDAAESQHKAAPKATKPPASAGRSGAAAKLKAKPQPAAGPGRAAKAGEASAPKAAPVGVAGKARAAAPGGAPAAAGAGRPSRPRAARPVEPVPEPAPVVPPAGWSTPEPAERGRPDLVGTAVQAVGELAQLGAAVSTSALRGVLKRLPRP